MRTRLTLTIIVSALFATGHSGRGEPEKPPKLTFSGYQWIVKEPVGLMGPGPNYFSPDCVRVDDAGRLHVSIVQRDSKWECGEVVLDHPLGYGTYRFDVDGDLGSLDPQVVLGLFTYSNAEDFHHREIDVEIGRWEKPKNANAQFVVQPGQIATNIHRFEVDGTGTHRFQFTWTPTEVDFSSTPAESRSDTADTVSWTYTGADLPKPGGEQIRINLWLIQGQPPQSAQPADITISAFHFEPLKQ